MENSSGEKGCNNFVMKNSFKVLFSIICLYVIIAKIYAIVYNLFYYRSDLFFYFVDLITICYSVVLLLLFWKKTNKIRNKTIWILMILASIFIQIFVGLLNYLSKDPREDRIRVLWTFDIPNLMSLFVMLFLMIIILKKNNS